ncbi:hypothetical protein QBC34DRAFT_461930 [Podospora aff. communis PSN243]|uniref:Uncharacterized protein n=1 Tax=Podospora aff. communis PSN243 TaxID=3040156 RepID=A0AAV9GUX7_9PEZI|nr:hypothetical protein QBC34DRAFT_461930 [Podospora aff. communis PSN243]
MHISSIFALLAMGLAPAWAAAVPVLDLPALDISPGAIPLDKFRLGGETPKLLKPKLPAFTGRLDFALKKRIALNWNDDGDDITKAELTASWDEQDDVKVINMADFGSALEKVDCTAPTMSLDFKQSAPYAEAKAAWNWVNGASKNNVILFVNHPSCGDDKAEAPFRVTAIRYDDAKFIAYLAVQEITDLESIIPDGDLVVETLADVNEPIVNTRSDITSSPELDKRITLKKSTTISLNKNFDNKNIFSIGSGANTLKLDCTDCGTRGKIKVKLYAKIRWFKVKKSYVEFRAEDVQAWLNLKLQGKGNKSGKGHKVVVPITAYGFEIKRIATLRIAADIGVGYDASIEGEGNVSWGATAKLSSPSVWRECFKGCEDEKTGWTINTTPIEPKGAGSLKAKLGVHAFITPKAEARIFKSGYEVGVAILAPKFEGTAKVAGNSNGGICANTKAILGVDVDLKVGLQCYAYAGDNYQTPDWRKTLFEKMWTVYDKCFILARKP